ncbi:hypothetical protein GCM10010156_77780 [Planobispora rosea]|uniref:WD40 repeat domain-containing protein n=1 Tax=Planobispora rosea TaxID=35762 RepID=A0A8J3S9R7_PLARO|nr:hypothetical protein [Planobispora rosea]GGT09471.1 hypothetical protein GCM10010156_77780 [Planobispora rosea]GIH89295.1 hypothetical protein Pro02_77030 [Planobispora rosea]
MALQKITDLDLGFCDVTFADEGRLLALDAGAGLWHVDLAGGSPLRLGDGEEIADAALEGFEGTHRRCDVTPRRISWHGGSATAVVHIDCGGHWLLLRRRDTGPWRPLLTGSRLVCSPELSWSADGTALAVGIDGVCIMQVRGSGHRADLDAESWGWTPSGGLLLYRYDGERWTLCLDPAPMHEPGPHVLGEPHADLEAWGWPGALIVAADGRTCTVAFRSKIVRYALPSLSIVHALDVQGVHGLTPSADQRRVVVESDGGVQVWDIVAGLPLTGLLPHLRDARVSPSGRHLAFRTRTPAAVHPVAEPGWSIWRLD